MDVNIEPQWKKVLQQELHKPYFQQLTEFVKTEYHTHPVYPKGNEIFSALNLCPLNKVKVVILGQDPYHGPNQAHGLCFSVREGIAFPPSLRNIFKELQADTGKPAPTNGDLTHWAKQGVLLLNATLTVRAHEAGSHQNKGWETFTDAAIKAVSETKNNVVFILWGAYAQKKGALIDRSKHFVLESVHPSPLSASRGFFGNNHFSKTNSFLISKRIEPIAW